MKNVCFIPIKSNSERVTGKNFRTLDGKQLYKYIIDTVSENQVFDDIFVDTDSQEIKDYVLAKNIKYIQREKELTSNSINGNDLLNHHFTMYPEYEYYFQLFVTSPFLSVKTIKECVYTLNNTDKYDSIFTGVENRGFYWMNNKPVNYRPSILPRSQDLDPLIEETTGLYGIRGDAFRKYRSRIGAKPYIYLLDRYESIDINVDEDLEWAAYMKNKRV